jgi:DNA-binding response OmpR family regulator
MKRILLIDDDPFMHDYLRRLLAEAYALDWAVTATAGLAALQRQHPDLVLMDLGLPDDEGFWLCASLRAAEPLLPILVLSARHRLQDRVTALQAGADDYLQKPFEREELLARIEAQLRKREAFAGILAGLQPQGPLRVAALSLDAGTRSAWVRDQRLRLSKTEFRLLETFCRQAGQALGRDYLLSEVWQIQAGSTRTVDNFVMRLRRKLADAVAAAGESLPLLETVYGYGYRLRAEAADGPD